ncbi:MAG: MBL fold metallo-hydrolase [Chitinophagales bacterium]
MKITFLGTGTSSGIPLIGCSCSVCTSSDWRDKRLRCSVLIEWNNYKLVIDVGTDFRQQMLRENVKSLDAVLITHAHIDHIGGLDELRAFNFIQGKDMPVYADVLASEMIKNMFAYVFAEKKYPGSPNIELHSFQNEKFSLGGKDILPIQVLHGSMPISGFRIDDFCYLTDVKSVSNAEKEKIKKAKLLVINAVRISEHHSHFNLQEAQDFIREMEVEKAYLMHISHRFAKHVDIEKMLDTNVYLPYDGLSLELN